MTLCAFTGSLCAGEISIWTEPKPPRVFAGEDKSVRLFIKNSAEAPRKLKLDARVYQVATAIAAPIGERKKWKETSIEAGQTIVEKFPLTVGTIRATTTFLLKFYEEGRVEETGSVPVLVYPEDLMAELKEVSANFQIALLDEENLLSPTLMKSDYGVRRMESLEARLQSDKPVLVIAVAPKETDLADASEELSKWTAGVLWLRRPNAAKPDELPIETLVKGPVTMVAADRNHFEQFSESPAAQSNLLRCVRRVLKGRGN